jgi:hypothetical protein
MNTKYYPKIKSEYAPVVLFVYNRLEHTKKAVASLVDNSEFNQSPFIVFSDGPKNTEDIKKIKNLRNYLHTIKHPNIRIIKNKTNLGLSRSVIKGVTEVCNEYGKIIVLEDDLVVSKSFLYFMNAGLNKYKNNKKIINIHGYSFPIAGLPNTFFIRATGSWGWATWKRGWDHFEADGNLLFENLKKNNAFAEFNFNNTYNYKKMLKDQINSKNDSWAVRFYASAFLKNMLTLYPGKSLVLNIGFDGSGTHCSSRKSNLDSSLNHQKMKLDDIDVFENSKVRHLWEIFFKDLNRNFFNKVKFKIRNYLSKYL